MSSANAPATPRPRRRRWVLAALAVLVLLALVTLRLVLQPQRATRLIVDRVGSALGLEITASGTGDYRLGATPTLVVRDVVVREPGARTPLLRADRILLSLPWSTIRNDAAAADVGPVVTRVEIDRPSIDLDALQHWLAQRPPGRKRLPTLTSGMQVREGRLVAGGWSLDDFRFDLPRLAPDERVTARTSGSFHRGDTRVPFALDLVLSRATRDSALGVAGQMGIEQRAWRMPARIVLSGVSRVDNDGWRMDRMKLAVAARYESGTTREPFTLGIAGTPRYGNGRLAMQPAGLAIHGTGVIPSLFAHGNLELADALAVQLAGVLRTWPHGWPALPAPLDRSSSEVPFALGYAGKPDLSAIAALQLQRDDARFDGRFHVPDLVDWIAAANAPSPLPPLHGHLAASRLDIAGAQLQGVEITLDDPAVQGPAKSR